MVEHRKRKDPLDRHFLRGSHKDHNEENEMDNKIDLRDYLMFNKYHEREEELDKTTEKVDGIAEKVDDLVGIINERILSREQREVQFKIFLYALFCAISAGAFVTSIFGFLGIYYSDSMKDIYFYSAIISAISLVFFWVSARGSLELTTLDFSGNILKNELIRKWHDGYQPEYEKIPKIGIITKRDNDLLYTMKIRESGDVVGSLKFNLKNMTFEVWTSTKQDALMKKLRADFEDLKTKGFIKITRENMKRES